MITMGQVHYGRKQIIFMKLVIASSIYLRLLISSTSMIVLQLNAQSSFNNNVFLTTFTNRSDQISAKNIHGMANETNRIKSNITNLHKTGMSNNQSTQSKPTANTESEQAAQSIKGAISSTGQFLGNVTNRIITSKSAKSILNESSEALGNATTTVKKYFAK